MINSFKEDEWRVAILDYEKGIHSVTTGNETVGTARNYCVSLSNDIKDRCCPIFWQRKWFCPHAWAMIIALHRKDSNDLYTVRYFNC